jgi:hypothetical protein
MEEHPIPDFSKPAPRKPLSKKLRFDVFKRDFFKCQYCGATPPAVVLEADHIHPVSQGGKDRIDNLITACFDCNRGKGAGLLSSVPDSLADRTVMMKEKLDQMKAFQRLINAKRKLEEQQIDDVQSAFKIHFDGHSFNPKFRESVRLFLSKLPAYVVVDYMHLACTRIPRMNDAVKYFCGICWKAIKEPRNG